MLNAITLIEDGILYVQHEFERALEERNQTKAIECLTRLHNLQTALIDELKLAARLKGAA